jgi:cytochrome c553
MSKKNLLSGRDKELQELAEQYEAAKAENKPIYLDADDLADLADWYADFIPSIGTRGTL